jgi:hypothetical protein
MNGSEVNTYSGSLHELSPCETNSTVTSPLAANPLLRVLN